MKDIISEKPQLGGRTTWPFDGEDIIFPSYWLLEVLNGEKWSLFCILHSGTKGVLINHREHYLLKKLDLKRT